MRISLVFEHGINTIMVDGTALEPDKVLTFTASLRSSADALERVLRLWEMLEAEKKPKKKKEERELHDRTDGM
jgi:hypothetical protein